MPRQLRLRSAANLASFKAASWGDDEGQQGILDSAVWQATMEAAEAALLRGRTADEIIAAISTLDMVPILQEMATVSEPGLRRNLPGLVHQLRDGEDRIRRFLRQVWGPADDLYQAATFIAYEIGDRVSRALAPDSRLTVLLGLHARACRVASEVRILAMNGFEAAASARWRSLHELAVVASLISAEDEMLADRYLAYAVIEQQRDVQTYQANVDRLGYQPHTVETLADLQQTHDDVLANFGVSMLGDNGWAAPLLSDTDLFLKERRVRVTFRALEERAGLDHLRPFYRLGSHHVHAGARAAELNRVTHLPDGPVLTTGSTVYADLAETSHATLISLTQVTANLVAHETKLDGSWTIDHLVGMEVLQRFVSQAGDRYVAAASRAAELGLIDHAPVQPGVPHGAESVQ